MNDILDKEFLEQKRLRQKSRVYFIWVATIAIGLLCRLMHWPFGALFTLVSSGGITAYAAAGRLSVRHRSPLNAVVLLLGGMWFVLLVWGAFFNGGYPHNFVGLGLFAGSFLIWFLVYTVNHRRDVKAFTTEQKEPEQSPFSDTTDDADSRPV